MPNENLLEQIDSYILGCSNHEASGIILPHKKGIKLWVALLMRCHKAEKAKYILLCRNWYLMTLGLG